MKTIITSAATLALVTILLVGCNQQQSATEEQKPVSKTGATMLNFIEHERGVEPYPTRLIVTEKYLRFDDGEGSADFVLLDRGKDVVYSVNSEEETVMAVHKKQLEIQPPFKLELTFKQLSDMEKAPDIEGIKPKHYQFSANGEKCYEVIAVQGLMPDVVTALQEFTDLLASDSKVTFSSLPADLHNPCDISMNTFAAGRHLRFGFPIQEWSVNGSGRALVDFQLNYQVDEALFVLPADYHHFTVQEFREGKVVQPE
ncbi:MAG: hypothetical protein OEU74_02380 [Gammaproteobacteria bacterium]|nr:hypothetical protein [Gammaproteobacteria bacterium]